MPVKSATTQRGFTLIEIIIVIAIIGILGAIAMPSFNVWRQNAQHRAEARSVMGALQQARVDAITQNTSITISFTGNTWSVNAVPPRTGGLKPETGTSLTLSSDPLDITFDSRGMRTSTADTVSVAGYKSTPYTVDVSLAGNISLQ